METLKIQTSDFQQLIEIEKSMNNLIQIEHHVEIAAIYFA